MKLTMRDFEHLFIANTHYPIDQPMFLRYSP